MKKTIISLMALAWVACGAEVLSSGQLDDLSRPITLDFESDQYFIAKIGNDASPAWGEVVISFTLSEIPTATGNHNLANILSSNIGTGNGQSVKYNAYGFYIEGTTLKFGRSHYDTSKNLTLADNSVIVTSALAADTTYTLTLLSQATGTPAGRGSDNFSITLTDEAGLAISINASGFGLNGAKCTGFFVGDADLKGSATFTASIPEPTTATLSLLALAGLATRRRRR